VLKELQGELPDRLQHAEAWIAIRPVRRVQQALVHERGDPLEHVQTAAGHTEDRLGGLHCERAHEDRQLAEERLFRCVEQVDAPGNRVPHGLLSSR
jgi:hypothetical protein